jgi:hypothetical protein
MRLLRAINDVHGVLAYELITDGLTILATLNETAEPVLPGGDSVRLDELPGRVFGGATLQVTETGFFLWPAGPVDLTELARVAVIYRFDGADQFFLDGKLEPVFNPWQVPSVFGTPTYWDLNEALSKYATDMALQSSCLILRECWENDQRLVFGNKPEDLMRRSLYQFLRSRLRGRRVDVRQEHNTDESHPVDIKVSWSLTARLAIIEIKWIGDSRTSNNNILRYRDSRAREGAKQLADYLNKEAQSAPNYLRRGYLIVYDGRRGEPDRRHYANVEITYEPRYHEERPDFERPRRFYLEPQQFIRP